MLSVSLLFTLWNLRVIFFKFFYWSRVFCVLQFDRMWKLLGSILSLDGWSKCPHKHIHGEVKQQPKTRTKNEAKKKTLSWKKYSVLEPNASHLLVVHARQTLRIAAFKNIQIKFESNLRVSVERSHTTDWETKRAHFTQKPIE